MIHIWFTDIIMLDHDGIWSKHHVRCLRERQQNMLGEIKPEGFIAGQTDVKKSHKHE